MLSFSVDGFSVLSVIKLFDFPQILAEGVEFEPMVRKAYNGFRVR